MRIVLLLALATGCGRLGFDSARASDAAGDAFADGRPLDDAGRGDPDGRFAWTSALFRGEPAPRQRDDLTAGVRGETFVAGTAVVARSAILETGVPSQIARASATLAIDGDRWLITNLDGVTVYDVTWSDPDHLQFVWNPSAPEATNPAPPLAEVAMERIAPVPANLAGARVLARAAYPAVGTVVAGDCTIIDGVAQILTGEVTISPELLLDLAYHRDQYTGNSCVGSATRTDDIGAAYLEVDGTSYRLWSDLGAGSAMTGTISIQPALVRMDATACEPAAGSACAAAPLWIELAPAGP